LAGHFRSKEDPAEFGAIDDAQKILAGVSKAAGAGAVSGAVTAIATQIKAGKIQIEGRSITGWIVVFILLTGTIAQIMDWEAVPRTIGGVSRRACAGTLKAGNAEAYEVATLCYAVIERENFTTASGIAIGQ